MGKSAIIHPEIYFFSNQEWHQLTIVYDNVEDYKTLIIGNMTTSWKHFGNISGVAQGGTSTTLASIIYNTGGNLSGTYDISNYVKISITLNGRYEIDFHLYNVEFT